MERYKKVTLSESGDAQESLFTVSGRKIPLKTILERLSEKHLRMGIMRKGNIKRYLLVWCDHASILNHGYLLLTVKSIYTTETYYSNKEMKDLFQVFINVQEIVESPNIYISLLVHVIVF